MDLLYQLLMNVIMNYLFPGMGVMINATLSKISTAQLQIQPATFQLAHITKT